MNLCRSQDKVMRIIIMINIISYKKNLKRKLRKLVIATFFIKINLPKTYEKVTINLRMLNHTLTQ